MEYGNKLNWNEGKVINLHYTDVCNYRCRFCHSRFGCTPLTFSDWEKIIGNIVSDVPVKRFNLAGGEPMAASYVQQMIDCINSCGIDCSIITNGSLLTSDFIRENREKLSMIGISMDAFAGEDNVRLGRVNGAGRTLSHENLNAIAYVIRECGIKLKINTVVNSVNCDKDYTGYINEIQPDRWKLLRMIRIDGVNDDADDLLVSDAQFEAFAERHRAADPVVENTSDIVNSYIVINPLGQLIDNSGSRYWVSQSLTDHSFAEEFQKIKFNEDAYQKRY